MAEPSVELVAPTQDPLGELEACLEVLGGYVDEFVFLTDETREFVTACWQTVELVGLLLADNEAAWASVDFLRAVTNDLQQQLAQREGRIWTPGQGGSSGQRRSPRAARHS